ATDSPDHDRGFKSGLRVARAGSDARVIFFSLVVGSSNDARGGAMLASTAVGLDEGGLAASLSLALGGDAEGMRRLVAGLMPIVQARVTRGLWRHQRRTGARRDPGQETDDLVQEVFAALFAGGAKTLRAWDPSRGLSLANFVGLVAEHEVSAR